VQGEPRFVAYCHCDNCWRSHGAGAVEWAGYEQANLELLEQSEAAFAQWRWPSEVHGAVAALDADPGKRPSARDYADRPHGCRFRRMNYRIWAEKTEFLPFETAL
jgi:hypothetical protein